MGVAPRPRLVLIALIASAFMLFSTAAAAASQAPGARLSVVQPLFRPLGGARVLASTSRDLPSGNTVGGYLAAEDEQDWYAIVHAGQPIALTLSTRPGYSGEVMVAVFDTLMPDTVDADPLLADPAFVSGTGSAELSFTAPYDTMIAISVYAPEASRGEYVLEHRIGDNPSPGAQDPRTAYHGIERVGGATRYETAIGVSQSAFGDGSCDTVIVATGRGFADALSASGLAGSYDCPILLTDPARLSAGVDAEVARIGASHVVVIGSRAAISDDVVAQLSHGGRAVERVQGVDRYATAAAIAGRIRSHETSAGRTPRTEAFVVSGRDYPDGLSVSPVAFATRMPVLLVGPGTVPAPTAREIARMRATKAYVIGGASTIPPLVMKALGVPGQRVAGASGRVSTSIAVAELAAQKGWASWKDVGITTGWNFPDGLAGGVALGKRGGVLLLTTPTFMPKELYDRLYAHRFYSVSPVYHVTALGSPASVFGCVLGHAEHAYWYAESWVEPMGVRYGSTH